MASSKNARRKRRVERRKLDIQASGGKSQITFTAPVEITAAAEEEAKRPTFSIYGYSGAAIRVKPFYSPVVVDLTGLKTSRDKLPILLDHDPSKIIGQSDSVEITSDGVRLSGTVTGDDPDSQKVVTHAKNGFEWQASIGANIVKREFLDTGKTSTVNGRLVTGPMVIAREATLHEVSFVAIGADSSTSTQVAATHNREENEMEPKFKAWLEAKGINPDELTDAITPILEAQFKAEQSPPPPANPSPQNNQDSVALDSIVAKRRKDQQRVENITKIAERALDENPRQIEAIEALARMAIEGGWGEDRFELELLRGTRPTAQLNLRRVEENKLSGKVLEATLCRTGGWSASKLEAHFDVPTLEASEKKYPNGLGLVELLQAFAKQNGHHDVGTSNIKGLLRAAFDTDIRASGFSTISIPGILSNTANKFLLEGWMAVDQTWSRISGRKSVRDFKTNTSYSLTGAFQYEKVGAGGELKHGTVGEQTYTNKADTYGSMFAITRTDIINDDLGALTAVPRRLGRGAALALNDVFWTAFLDNSSFFASGNNNVSTGGGSALGLAGIAAAEVVLMNQTDPDGKPLGLMPKILLVPPTLKATGMTLMNSQAIIDGTGTAAQGATNIWQGRFSVESSPYMENSNYTGYSTAAWYLLCDPMELPVIEVAFLNGRETPIVESADADFNVLGIQMRGYHDFGVATQEPRGGVRSAGS